MRTVATDGALESAIAKITDYCLNASTAQPGSATSISSLAKATGLRQRVVREGLASLIASGQLALTHRPCCSPSARPCHPADLCENERIHLTAAGRPTLLLARLVEPV